MTKMGFNTCLMEIYYFLIGIPQTSVLRQPVGEDVREPAPVCPCCRRPWGGCAGAADAGLRSRSERQGGGGRAFFCPYGGSPAAPGGEGGVVTKKDQGTDLGPFLCYSALICSSVRPVACWMTSFDRLISSIRRATCSIPFSIPFCSAKSMELS